MKLSITVPDHLLPFLDGLGSNRSRSITVLIEDYKKRKDRDKLKNAYLELAAQNQTSGEWEAASAIDIEKDL